MWFDRIDPRDPIKMTDGVWGIRYMYNFLDNSSIWLWGLYGNYDTKGYETEATKDNKAEFGGRYQYPVPYGEIAVTFHSRLADASTLDGSEFRENRYAIDVRWDVLVGLWFEAMLQEQRTNLVINNWKKLITLGADYTFDLGNGLYVLGEHMTSIESEKSLTNDEDHQISAFSLSYPIGFSDNLTAYSGLDWDHTAVFIFLSWQRTINNLAIDLSLFNYPESESGGSTGDSFTGGGLGGRIMFVYTH